MFGLDREIKPLTTEQGEILRSEPITADGPGTILHDFDKLLKFIGIDGVEAGGELRLPPMRMLADLNAAMREPLRLDMQRAQLRSYPNLNSLYMLGRASGLVMPVGGGKDARLAVDPELLGQWVAFTPVERYCMLLEAWLFRANWEAVGERRGWEPMLYGAVRTWTAIGAKGLKVPGTRRSVSDPYSQLPFDRYYLPFLWLFGLIAVEQAAPVPRRIWTPGALRRIPFGDALIALLASHWRKFTPLADREDDSETDSDQPQAISLNRLQPILKPYFPGWVNSLTIPEPEFREGTYIFKALLNKIWRRIAVPADASWDDLGNAIRKSVGFDDDHLWAFTWIDRFGDKMQIVRQFGFEDGAPEDGLGGDEVSIGGIPLRLGEPMTFVYDFGDHWQFEVIPERIDPPDPKLKKPKVIGSHGKAPKQYEGEWE